ncbi:MAG: peptidase M23, partial [Burkholderiales bacterium PBB5]
MLQRANASARRHPRRVAAAVLTVLGGFGITAFGIAPLAPDAALLPQRIVTEQVKLQGIDGQLDALALHDLQLSRHDTTRPGDTADSLLKRLGVADPTAANFIRNNADARRLIDGRGGKLVQASMAADGTLLELIGRFPALDPARASTHFTRLKVLRSEGQFRVTLETAPLLAQARLGSGSIRTSLWAATDEARLPDAIAAQLIEIFSGDVDFHRQLKKGDTFSVVYEALPADDAPITWNEGTGRLLAAEVVNNG